MDWLKSLMEDPVAWAILALISLGSFVYAVVCQHINQERKGFSYTASTHTWMERGERNFQKAMNTYAGQGIQERYITEFTIWNSGNKTIHPSDMVPSRELGIVALADCEILDAKIVKAPEITNRFALAAESSSKWKITFDYVDRQEGLVLQVIHTGACGSVAADCKLKGGGPKKSILDETDADFPEERRWVARFVDLFLALGVLLSGLVAFFMTKEVLGGGGSGLLYMGPPTTTPEEEAVRYSAIAGATACWMFVAFLGMALYTRIKSMFRLRPPKALRGTP